MAPDLAIRPEQNGTAAFQWSPYTTANPSAPPFSISFPTQITFGIPFLISASETISSGPYTGGGLGTGGGNASASFQVGGFLIDGTNFVLTSYQYTTADGEQLFGSPQFIATPEPPYSWLIAAGLCAAALHRMRSAKAN